MQTTLLIMVSGIEIGFNGRIKQLAPVDASNISS